MKTKHVIGSAVLLAVVLAVLLSRFAVVASGPGYLYRVNRLTGTVSICAPAGCERLAEKQP